MAVFSWCTGLRLLVSMAQLSTRSVATVARLETGAIIEPKGAHQSSVLLFHGLGEKSYCWQPFYKGLEASGVRISGVRWIALKAPKQMLWGTPMSAWFEYKTDHSGTKVEDDIDEESLSSMRAQIHEMMAAEADKLKHLGGLKRVLLMGSSQGGSMALDAALTFPSPVAIAGAVMLRSIAMSASIRAACKSRCGATGLGAGNPKLSVLAVSGRDDDTFVLELVEQQLSKLPALCVDVKHEVFDDLDHYVKYDAREMAAAVAFIATQLELEGPCSLEPSLFTAVLAERHGYDKSWDTLSDTEKRAAAQLGASSKNSWDQGTAAVWNMKWDQLSHLQRESAKSLGWTAASWDDDDCDEWSLAKDKDWAQLTEAERKLAARLGVSGASAWDNGTAPVWMMKWAKLKSPQQQAAKELGWNAHTWDSYDE